tara:strand:- start:2364 stop:2780 length:417 start_codon:yes stop_codon:yes gene_type:complete
MKINVDRLATLAGIESTPLAKPRNNVLKESVEEPVSEKEEELKEKEDMEELDQVVEIDEVMLVQELRRAKKYLNEARRQRMLKQKNEIDLQKIIEEEVQNIFGDLNLNSDWVYGKEKPARSKKGYVHQGSYLKGLGFK